MNTIQQINFLFWYHVSAVIFIIIFFFYLLGKGLISRVMRRYNRDAMIDRVLEELSELKYSLRNKEEKE